MNKRYFVILIITILIMCFWTLRRPDKTSSDMREELGKVSSTKILFEENRSLQKNIQASRTQKTKQILIEKKSERKTEQVSKKSIILFEKNEIYKKKYIQSLTVKNPHLFKENLFFKYESKINDNIIKCYQLNGGRFLIIFDLTKNTSFLFDIYKKGEIFRSSGIALKTVDNFTHYYVEGESRRYNMKYSFSSKLSLSSGLGTGIFHYRYVELNYTTYKKWLFDCEFRD